MIQILWLADKNFKKQYVEENNGKTGDNILKDEEFTLRKLESR